MRVRAISAMSGMVTGASLTAEELCGASGLSEIELASLEEAEAIRAEAFSSADEQVARAQGERAAMEKCSGPAAYPGS